MTDKQSPTEIFGSDRMWGLKELPLPDPISWWPQTPGWYVLGGLAVAGLCYLMWRLWMRYQHNAYRREGLARLGQNDDRSGGAQRAAAALEEVSLDGRF